MLHRPLTDDRLAGLLLMQRGLSDVEVATRRARFGANDILETRHDGLRVVLRDTVRDPMLWFLLGTSALFFTLGDLTDGLIMLLALVPIVGMDAYLHRRTQASTRGLRTHLAATAQVLRDGLRREVKAQELVPGDLVYVGAGEPFPADGLVIDGVELVADESALSGESHPVRKRALGSEHAADAAREAASWVFAGTRLLTGQAVVRIAYTGAQTLYGEIARSALAGRQARTPLQTAVSALVAVMVLGALSLCVALAGIRLVQGHGLADALLSAVTLAVAALPEEYPVVFTFFLGVGVYRLAQRRTLVRRAVAVENIGRVTCICSDKTGTLTMGKLTLTHRLPAASVSPEQLLDLAALAARAEQHDPLDAALLQAAPPSQAVERLASFPFTESRRRETSVVRLPDGACLSIVKGAPETVLALCSDAADVLDRLRSEVETYAATGHKVIACARRTLDEATWPGGEPDRGYTCAGLLVFEDALRDGVPQAIAACRRAGIRVIMVTGDHPATAQAIAREIGLGDGVPKVLSADALATLPERDASTAMREADVIARAAPAQKLQLVRALQASGEIVAVTGDGVNDVPALQAADIGIAMGARGTQSAREVAAIVLLDDDFGTIVEAIAEGRQLFLNLQLSFAYLLMVHIPLVLSAALIPLAGYPLLYMPIHVVWLELIIHPTALLVFQDLPSSRELLPVTRAVPLRFFDRWAWAAITLAALCVTAVVTFGYDFALGAGRNAEHARAMALTALIVASATSTAILSGLRSRSARVMVALGLLSLLPLVQLRALAVRIHLAPLHLADWGLAAAAGLVAGLTATLVRFSLRAGTRRR